MWSDQMGFSQVSTRVSAVRRIGGSTGFLNLQNAARIVGCEPSGPCETVEWTGFPLLRRHAHSAMLALREGP